MCERTDSSLEVSESYDVNAISNDSGVSVTSAYKSSQISAVKNKVFDKGVQDFISTVPVISLFTASCDKKLLNFKEQQTKELIAFESCNVSEDSEGNSSELLKLNCRLSAHHICDICKKYNFCWHLKIPPPSVVFVERNMMIVMLSHIVNPYEFYVNMAMEEIVTLDELRDQMSSTYESRRKELMMKTEDLTVNMICAGRFNEDDYWYRVKIVTINTEVSFNFCNKLFIINLNTFLPTPIYL